MRDIGHYNSFPGYQNFDCMCREFRVYCCSLSYWYTIYQISPLFFPCSENSSILKLLFLPISGTKAYSLYSLYS